MKKICLFFVFFCISINAFSQCVFIKAGVNFSNVFLFGNPNYNNYQYKTGFHLGGSFEIPIDTNVFFESGIFCDAKGFKINNNTPSDPKIKVLTELYYIEIPFLFKYKHQLNQIQLIGAFGPNIGIGIFGFQIQKGSIYVPDRVRFDCFEESGGYRRFYGALFGSLGIEYTKYIFVFNCNFGLTNLYEYRYAPYYSSYSFSISIGYKLWTKKK
jgi:hypothetical protein